MPNLSLRNEDTRICDDAINNVLVNNKNNHKNANEILQGR